MATNTAHHPSMRSFLPLEARRPLLKWTVLLLGACLLPGLLMAIGVSFASPVESLAEAETVDLYSAHRSLRGSFVHTILEWTSVCAAGFVGLMAMVQYRLTREISLPIIGLAMVCAGAMDAFHTLAADRLMAGTAADQELMPYTWALCRFFTGAIQLIGIGLFAVWLKGRTRLPMPAITVIALGFLVFSWAIVHGAATSPTLPQTIYPDALIKRPFDLAPIAVFLLSGLVVMPLYCRRRPSPFAFALLLSLIPQLAVQLYMVFGSERLFDSAFNVAHAVKTLAYLVPLGGLLVQYSRTFVRQEEAEIGLQAIRQDAAQASADKGEFLAAMSHEIRTPMNGVLGMSSLMIDTDLTEDQREYTRAIQTSAESLLRLVNDIYDLSKIEAGSVELKEEQFDLQALFDETAGLLGHRAAEQGLQLCCSLRPEIPNMLEGDAHRLRQVLMNLGSNAIKFTPEGEVTIQASLVYDDGSAIKVRFEVKDTGIGIPKHALNRLFRSFSQVDASTTRKYGGSGLGLAISKELVTLMQGEVGVDSVEHEGSTFWFTVRLKKQLGANCVLVPSADPLATTRVMIADANLAHREALTSYLSSWGCRVISSTNAWELIDGLRDVDGAGTPAQVAFIDLGLPGQEIEELLAKLSYDPSTTSTKRIALVPVGAPFDEEALTDGRFHGVLRKPIAKGQFRAVLCAALGVDEEPVAPAQDSASELQEAASLATHGDPVGGASALVGARILLVEDNLVNQKVAMKHLENIGCEVDVAGNGVLGVDHFREGNYDLILMDCQMPEMDGYEATTTIRGMEDEDSHIPIVAMTANAMAGDREACLDAGMDDYISKPFTFDDLTAILQTWLEKAAKT